MYVSMQTRRVPAFVINLDRRYDRMHTFLSMSERHGIAAVRIRAVDGQLLAQTSSISASSFSEEPPGDELQQLQYNISRSSSSNSKTSLAISEEDVTATWNSSLNSKFDVHCFRNTVTPMTHSERACAASHLSVWRHIAALRSAQNSQSRSNSQTNSKTKRTKESTKSASGGGSSGECETAPDLECIQIAQSVFQLTQLGGGWEPCVSSNIGGTHKSSSSGGIDEDWFLVFEDDASIVENATAGDFRRTLSHIVRNLPADFDICYLGSAIPWATGSYPNFGALFYKPNYLWMLHAYILRGRAVDVLLSSLPICAPVDNFVAELIYEKRLVAYALKDHLVKQEVICIHTYNLAQTCHKLFLLCFSLNNTRM